ncbi:(d)CMP kinase [Varibaculum vaginae]|uniref:(d)CMP kinase n=1 Tax=Varibaculum vaginae TaxID=2364797 RepID=UPI000F07849C|nr:(d)CMP kinase [Varibaculum vaginae]
MSGDGSQYIGQQILGAGLVIAIDGPSGAGKSTIARLSAAELGTNFLDTGAMYRALTWYALQQGTDLNDPAALAMLAYSIPMQVEAVAHAPRILIEGRDVSRLLRGEEINRAVSQVSAVPGVREQMIARQRQIIQAAKASGRGIVAEGRDITTVVAPDADVKILLTASPQVREQRRAQQQGAGSDSVIQRDLADSQVNNFTTPAPGVELLDSSDLNQEETMEAVVAIVGRAFHARQG